MIKRVMPKIIAMLMVMLLVVFNVNIDKKLSMSESKYTVSLSANEAQAKVYVDVRLGTHTCWSTGRTIDYCEYDPEYLCDSSEQDAC